MSNPACSAERSVLDEFQSIKSAPKEENTPKARAGIRVLDAGTVREVGILFLKIISTHTGNIVNNRHPRRGNQADTYQSVSEEGENVPKVNPERETVILPATNAIIPQTIQFNLFCLLLVFRVV